MDEQRAGAVVVGAHLDTPLGVLRAAADAAHRWSAGLVCVHVEQDPVPYVEPLAMSGITSFGDGMDLAFPPLPPVPEADVEAALRQRFAPLLDLAAPGWRIAVEHGDAADALARVAEREGAPLIVVGTQEGRTGVRDLFGASTATHLAHRQHRPILVVPGPRGSG